MSMLLPVYVVWSSATQPCEKIYENWTSRLHHKRYFFKKVLLGWVQCWSTVPKPIIQGWNACQIILSYYKYQEQVLPLPSESSTASSSSPPSSSSAGGSAGAAWAWIKHIRLRSRLAQALKFTTFINHGQKAFKQFQFQFPILYGKLQCTCISWLPLMCVWEFALWFWERAERREFILKLDWQLHVWSKEMLTLQHPIVTLISERALYHSYSWWNL